MAKNSYDQGRKVLKSKYQKADIEMIDKLEKISPDFTKMVIGYGLGKIWTRTILNDHFKEIIAITTLITTGSVDLELQGHFHTALTIGLKPNELKELILLVSLYVGVPKSINALLLLQTVLDERRLNERS